MGRPKGTKATKLVVKWMTSKGGKKYRRYFKKTSTKVKGVKPAGKLSIDEVNSKLDKYGKQLTEISRKESLIHKRKIELQTSKIRDPKKIDALQKSEHVEMSKRGELQKKIGELNQKYRNKKGYNTMKKNVVDSSVKKGKDAGWEQWLKMSDKARKARKK